ncbi:MAG TPA: sortase [Candidatus Woesebacteria bacterium]|nr:sortase [Candidatus Woesebacteria bacterium]HNS65163.1 sortase [Candidatus Woesebacteria bacterium]
MPNKSKKTKHSKKKKSVKKNSRQYLPAVLVLLGSILLCVSILHQVWRLRALLPNFQSVAEIQPVSAQRDLGQRPVAIELNGKTISIKPGTESATGWTLDRQSAFHVEQSAYPGEAGNAIVYGHNTSNIFGSLKLLKINDLIEVTTLDGTTRNYQVFDVTTVPPDENGYLFPTNREQLTIYTCAGFLDKDRLIVRAVPDGF